MSTLYKSIEELESKINRKPAQVVVPEPIDAYGDMPPRQRMGGRVEEVLPLPEATHFDDPNTPGLRRPTAAGVTGGFAPDYSKYDEILAKMKPRDTSNQDLINMGISTGVGLLFGRPAVGAKVAGEYGLQRAAAQEKRDSDFEQQLLKIQMDRAARMAKGSKGTKTSGEDPTKGRYIDRSGNLRTPTMLRQDGTWAQLATDPLYSIPSTQNIQQNNPDGSTRQNLVRGTEAQKIGALSAENRLTTGPDGQLITANLRTNQAQELKGSDTLNTQKTVSGVSPKVKEGLSKIQADFERDDSVKKLEMAYSDIQTALDALKTASPDNILLIRRALGIAMDKGRSLTNDEFGKVENLDLGLMNKIDNLIAKNQTGDASNLARQAYEKMSVSVEKAARDLYNKKVGRYNDRVKFVTGTEFRPDMLFQFQSPYTAKKQNRGASEVENRAKELSAGTTRMVTIVGPDGKKTQVKTRFNGETQKWDRVE